MFASLHCSVLRHFFWFVIRDSASREALYKPTVYGWWSRSKIHIVCSHICNNHQHKSFPEPLMNYFHERSSEFCIFALFAPQTDAVNQNAATDNPGGRVFVNLVKYLTTCRCHSWRLDLPTTEFPVQWRSLDFLQAKGVSTWSISSGIGQTVEHRLYKNFVVQFVQNCCNHHS